MSLSSLSLQRSKTSNARAPTEWRTLELLTAADQPTRSLRCLRASLFHQIFQQAWGSEETSCSSVPSTAPLRGFVSSADTLVFCHSLPGCSTAPASERCTCSQSLAQNDRSILPVFRLASRFEELRRECVAGDFSCSGSHRKRHEGQATRGRDQIPGQALGASEPRISLVPPHSPAPRPPSPRPAAPRDHLDFSPSHVPMCGRGATRGRPSQSSKQ